MSKNIAIFIGLVIILFLGGSNLLKDKTEYKAIQTESVVSPWIEVVNPNIYVLRNDGSNEKELHTGDEVIVGSTLKSSASGRATIHLPDGSAIRLDSDSIITIDKVDFNSENEELTVRISLLSGRVWSKVVALVTPESSWEVKTTSAVATVRGTAFFTEYKNNKSRVWSSQHSVYAKPIDPITKKAIEEARVEVSENKVVDIIDSNVKLLSEKRISPEEVLAVKDGPKDILSEDWIKENISQDKITEDRIFVMKKEGLDEKRQREEIRKENSILKDKADLLREEKKTDKEIIKEIRRDRIEDFKLRLEERINIEVNQIDETKTTEESSTIEKTAVPVRTTETTRTSALPVRLIISSKILPEVVNDGTKISFNAFLVMSDNTRKDVTQNVEWKVVGSFGKFEIPGVFVAKIRDEDSEIGDIKGGVIASYKDGEKIFEAPQINFVVTPNVEETVPQG